MGQGRQPPRIVQDLTSWLADRPGQGASESEVRRRLSEVSDLQSKLAELAGRVSKRVG